MLRCAIYARFSSDRQSETSAEDQISVCRERAEREGWRVVEVYRDLAISGANIRRPDMTRMMKDIVAGRFDIVLAEALDRLARDQEDIAGIYKRAHFAGARIFTLAQGEVSELHIGLAGTMDALELKKHAEKVRRGARGALSRGLIPGGIAYGYAPDRKLRDDGTVDRGRRRIVEEEAIVIRRIFQEYADGIGPREIAKRLNADGIVAPRSAEWRGNTIVGGAGRRTGILRNPVYVGRYVWNRVHMVRDPESRKRLSRVNDAAELHSVEVPQLRIVDDVLWERVQELLGALGRTNLPHRQRPRHFLSRLVLCGQCGATYQVIDRDRWGCSRHREKGTCANGQRIAGAELEARVLHGLQEKLLAPDVLQLVVKRYHDEQTRIRRSDGAVRAHLERKLRAIDEAIDRLVAAIADGASGFAQVKEALTAKQQERERLEAALSELQAPSVIALHPQIVDAYRKQIASLAQTLRSREVNDATSAGKVRGLIDRIVVTPAEDHNAIEVTGSLHAVIGMAEAQQSPRRGVSHRRGSLMVAEEGLEPPTPGL